MICFPIRPFPLRHPTDHAGQCNCSPVSCSIRPARCFPFRDELMYIFYVRQGMILKIQLLRLVHNFCSHSSFKHVLLSYSEIEELKQLYTAYENPQTAVPSINTVNHPYCTGRSGLLSKIIAVLKDVPTSSIFRYFLSKFHRLPWYSIEFEVDFGCAGRWRVGCAAAAALV